MTAKTIAPAVSAGLMQIADSPSLSLTHADVPAAAELVTRHILPTLEHLSNGESWYRSRVTWGAVISAAAPVLPLLGMGADWFDPTLGAAFLAATGSAIGAACTLYGRWRATRPIGR
ncbi:hypothetical protein NDN16_15660 [Aureimonas altamirensis]|uniref:hypothetical protein n=1 Tax=Aureimonas altamirensis TaxID=370622 RepID=UPI00203690FE|nr:hypothetical protein [Aureimonas altamirensis]MCM2505107.1 hypothetical protein [Aureimonas altamirensis]